MIIKKGFIPAHENIEAKKEKTLIKLE
jgi:hypothetical protein